MNKKSNHLVDQTKDLLVAKYFLFATIYQSRKLVNIMKENNNIGFNVESRCKLNKESLFDKNLYFNVLEYVEMKITPSKV
jgi:hypothetical protein